MDSILGEVKRLKASVRAKAEHSFRRGKRQFAQFGLRYRGMRANTAQLRMVFAPSKLCMTASHAVGTCDGHILPNAANAA